MWQSLPALEACAETGPLQRIGHPLQEEPQIASMCSPLTGCLHVQTLLFEPEGGHSQASPLFLPIASPLASAGLQTRALSLFPLHTPFFSFLSLVLFLPVPFCPFLFVTGVLVVGRGEEKGDKECVYLWVNKLLTLLGSVVEGTEGHFEGGTICSAATLAHRMVAQESPATSCSDVEPVCLDSPGLSPEPV